VIPMLVALAFASGAASLFLLERYLDYRRTVRNEAWETIKSQRPMRLSEVYRRQGYYDTREN
jgi:hypothetical protein